MGRYDDVEAWMEEVDSNFENNTYRQASILSQLDRIEAKIDAATVPPTDPPPVEPPPASLPDPPTDLVVIPDPPPPTTGELTILEALYGTYRPTPDLKIARLPIVFQRAVFPSGGYTLTQAMIDAVAARNTGAGRVCIDVEHLYPHSLSAPQDTTDLLTQLMAGLQQRRPGTDWGVYGLPVRNYWSQDAEWRAQGDHVRPVLEHCDTIYPSCYVFYRPWDQAKVYDYIGNMVTESARIAPGKPILPFLWPVFHGGGNQTWGTELTPTEWRDCRNAALSAGASGYVIWGDKYGPLNDGGPGGWWAQAKADASIGATP